MNSKQEYAYKWTQKDQDGGFRTVQADTVEDIIKNMDMLELAIKLRNTTPEPEKPVTTQPIEPEDPSMCPVHQLRMTKKEGKYGSFYSHYIGVVPNGSWCNGKK